jgi:hypothetical protein
MRTNAATRAVIFALALACGGCADLLPKFENEVAGPWGSFDEAKARIESLESGRATMAELRALGIDPGSPNVQVLTYSDIMLRFPSGSIPHERLDKGLRDCLDAGKACVGYFVNVSEIRRDRVGNFWLDAFSFKRVVEVRGWTFNALILVVGDRVVYTLHGGQPNVRENEVRRQPLGPVQDFGNSVNIVR